LDVNEGKEDENYTTAIIQEKNNKEIKGEKWYKMDIGMNLMFVDLCIIVQFIK
jgi:hypothetical protein